MKRRVGVVTVGRSDYGYYYPLLKAAEADPNCELHLIVGGAHLSPQYGNTVAQIEADGFEISKRVHMLLSDDSPEAIATSIGVGVMNFAAAYSSVQPEILVLLGDRFEMLAAAIAALPLRLPIAHIHGGEVTQGAIDDGIRHAITKLSHLHFAAAPAYANRIQQMGEDPERVFVTGSPIVDAILAEPIISKHELENELGAELDDALLVTYHPVTLEHERTEENLQNLLAALDRLPNELLFTYPNADTGNALIIDQIQKFALTRPRVHIFINLGHRKYHAIQRYAAVMVGNSSSGILEAALFNLPVVNIGDRQKGRLRTPNIIDVRDDVGAIETAIQTALSSKFKRSLTKVESPYGKGDASRKILEVIMTVPLNGELLKKKFFDLSGLREAIVASAATVGN